MKQTPIWFNLQRDGTGNGLSNVNLHQSMRFFKAGLSTSYVMAVGKIYKEKVGYLMCQIPIKMLNQIIHQKGAEKLVKDEIYV